MPNEPGWFDPNANQVAEMLQAHKVIMENLFPAGHAFAAGGHVKVAGGGVGGGGGVPKGPYQWVKNLPEPKHKQISDMLSEQYGGKFKLFGSREMAKSIDVFGGLTSEEIENIQAKTLNSDYDFAAQDNALTENLMVVDGWNKVEVEEYVDNQTTHVYENTILDEKVQIAFKKDIKLYMSCWDQIDTEFFFRYLWKQSPTALPREHRNMYFNTLFASYECGQWFPVSLKSDKKVQGVWFEEPVPVDDPFGPQGAAF